MWWFPESNFAPPGLTIVTISQDAKDVMNQRKTPIASFYANLKVFEHYYEENVVPLYHACKRHLCLRRT